MKKILLGLLAGLNIVVAQAAEVVVVAGDPNSTSSSGAWNSATAASMPYQGNPGMYASVSGSISTYTFTPTLPETTSYTVEVYNSCYTPRSNQVIHRIVHAAGTSEHIVEQDCQLDPYVGQWRTLGTYSFNSGTSSSLTIDTTGSNNSYVGATAVRFVYQATNPPANSAPTITPSVSSISVQEGEQFTVAASAFDSEDGDLTASIGWSALGISATGGQFTMVAASASFTIDLLVTDSNSAQTNGTISVNVIPNQTANSTVYDFSCQQLEPLAGDFFTNNAAALPNVGKRCGQYIAELTDNSNDKTLHYHTAQGRFDGVLVSFPFKVIARNIGVAPMNQPTANHEFNGYAYIFAGLQAHHTDFSRADSMHLVVGQRGLSHNTIEGKTTLNGSSSVNDVGADVLPTGRADLMFEGLANGEIIAYWQVANTTGSIANDNWQLYNGTGQLPGVLPSWGGNNVYVGLITYAFGQNGVPFMGVADSLAVEN